MLLRRIPETFFDISVTVNLIVSLLKLGIFYIYEFLLLTGLGLAILVMFAAVQIMGDGTSVSMEEVNEFYQNFISLWLPHPAEVRFDLQQFYANAPIFLIQFCIIIGILGVVAFAYIGSVRGAILSFLSIYLLILFPMICVRIGIPFENLKIEYSDPLMGVLLAVISYVGLEMSFRSSYVDEIFEKSMKRSRRIERQVNELLRFKEKISEKPQMIIPRRPLLTIDAIHYLRELIERRTRKGKYEIGRQRVLKRASAYLKDLQRKDPRIKIYLAPRITPPEERRMLLSLFKDLPLRIPLLLTITYAIVYFPKIIIEKWGSTPLTESVEALIPELTVFLLVPIVMLLLLVSKIAHRRE